MVTWLASFGAPRGYGVSFARLDNIDNAQRLSPWSTPLPDWSTRTDKKQQEPITAHVSAFPLLYSLGYLRPVFERRTSTVCCNWPSPLRDRRLLPFGRCFSITPSRQVLEPVRGC